MGQGQKGHNVKEVLEQTAYGGLGGDERGLGLVLESGAHSPVRS